MDDEELARVDSGSSLESPYQLRLYIAGNASRSRRAVLAVARLVAVERSMGRAVDLEVIDVFQQGERARAAKLIGVPALIRDGPRMSCRLLGDLSDQQRIVRALRLSSLESCEREGSGG